ncbi:hypothetical protein GEV33_012938 [Tenebrio molitor]|uniref:Uncharacterized protein n=1 Tax=Tenebrio molitor TaxID=7067 RepID=A0A8J6H9T9_TENMO|nr:hypothetical protein GEV33_012938 [Tenebrio molitor]
MFGEKPTPVLCIYPDLVAPWPIAGVALWLGLVQDLLIPIGLSIVDSRFCKWVSNVYRCSERHGGDKLPHVGLDGKFRPFSSPPQSLEVSQNQHVRALQTVEHRFPITNGSLYTSIDGRLPVIHNYRRHKDQRGLKQLSESVGHMRRHDFFDHSCQPQAPPPEVYACRSCETDLCPSHSNLHHLSPQYINKQLNLMQNSNLLLNKNPMLVKRTSLSQESLRYIPENQAVYHQDQINNPVMKNSRNLVRLNKMRLCKSEDSLNEVSRDLKEFKDNPEAFQKTRNKSVNEQILDYSSSDDDYLTDNNPNERNQNFDTLSSRSSYSITTEANCDFEFFQSKESRPPTTNYFESRLPMSTFKTTEQAQFDRNKRSSSKRSLDNVQALFKENEFPISKIQRSNSYMTLEDRNKRKNCKKLLRSNSKLSDCTHNIRQKIKSVEYLPNSNASTVFIEDVFYFNYPNQRKCGEMRNYVGSVPDLKKVFISEYI